MTEHAFDPAKYEVKPLGPNGALVGIEEAIGERWPGFKANWRVLVGSFLLHATVFAGILLALAPMLIGLAFGVALGAPRGSEAVAIVIYIAALQLPLIPVWAFFFSGWITICLKIVRGQKPQTADLFSNSGKILPAVGGLALIALGSGVGLSGLILAVTGLMDLGEFTSVLVLLAGLLLLVIGTVLSMMFFFTLWLITDKDMGVLEAARTSMKITRGHKSYLLSFTLLALVLVVLGTIFSVGLLLIIVFPLLVLAAASIYEFLAKTAFESGQHAAEGRGSQDD